MEKRHLTVRRKDTRTEYVIEYPEGWARDVAWITAGIETVEGIASWPWAIVQGCRSSGYAATRADAERDVTALLLAQGYDVAGQTDEAAGFRATIARMDATIRFLRDQYRTAVGLPTVPPEGTCPTCGQPVGAP